MAGRGGSPRWLAMLLLLSVQSAAVGEVKDFRGEAYEQAWKYQDAECKLGKYLLGNGLSVAHGRALLRSCGEDWDAASSAVFGEAVLEHAANAAYAEEALERLGDAMAHASPWALHVKARLLQRAGRAFEHVDHEACSAGAALAGGAAPGPKSPQIAKSCFEGAWWKHALGKRGEARDALNRAVAVDPLAFARLLDAPKYRPVTRGIAAPDPAAHAERLYAHARVRQEAKEYWTAFEFLREAVRAAPRVEEARKFISLCCTVGEWEAGRAFLREAEDRALFGKRDRLALKIQLYTSDAWAKGQDANSTAFFKRNLLELFAEVQQLDDAALHEDELVELLTNLGWFGAYEAENQRETRVLLARVFLVACPSLGYVSPTLRPHAGGRIKVGIVLKFAYGHSVGLFLQGIVKHLAHRDFDLTLFVPGFPEGGLPVDPVSHAIVAHVGRVVYLPAAVSSSRAVIEGHAPDALFYPEIGMDPLTYFLAFSRLAPLQFTTHGNSVTSGIPAMDYFLSYRLIEVEDAQSHYSERLVLLPGHHPLMPQFHVPGVKLSKADLGLEAHHTMYLVAQGGQKLQAAFLRTAMAILAEDPAGVMVFVSSDYDDDVTASCARIAGQPDIARRLRFLPRLLTFSFLQVLKIADVLLDTFPVSGCTTSWQSVSAGRPIVTLPSRFMRGQFTAGMFRKLGMLEFVAASPEDYVAIAAKLGMDPGHRMRLEDRFREARSVLFNDLEAAGAVGTFIQRKVVRSRAGDESPDAAGSTTIQEAQASILGKKRPVRCSLEDMVETSLERVEKLVSRFHFQVLQSRIAVAEQTAVFRPRLFSAAVPPECLMGKQRLDIMSKLLYAESFAQGDTSTFPLQAYNANLRHLNGFTENNTFIDSQGHQHSDVTKRGFGDFLRGFRALLADAQDQGLKPFRSLVPVVWQMGTGEAGLDLQVLDGAHRVAAAHAHGAKVPVLLLEHPEAWPLSRRFDYSSLLAMGLQEKYLLPMLFKYCQVRSDAHLAVLFPAAAKAARSAEYVPSLLREGMHIVHEREVRLTNLAPYFLVEQLYQDILHALPAPVKFQWIVNKVQQCFPGYRHEDTAQGWTARVYVMEAPSLEDVKLFKDEVRRKVGVGHASIHMNDHHHEAVEMAKLLLHQQTVAFMNKARPVERERFGQLLDTAAAWAREVGITDAVAVDSGGVLAAYGLRDINDLDIIAASHVAGGLTDAADIPAGVQVHSNVSAEAGDEIIYNPTRHFYYKGLKFVDLVTVKHLKGARLHHANADPVKDVLDIDLIDELMEPPSPKPAPPEAGAATEAYVSFLFADNPHWVLGLGVLARSLRKTGTRRKLVLMVTPNVPRKMTDLAARFGWEPLPVAGVPHPHPRRCAKAWQVTYGEQSISEYSKLRVFGLAQFTKVVYLDSDTMVTRNIDDLFERPATPLAAAPSLFPPDKFNAGVMVIAPDAALLARILDFAAEHPSYTCGDQGMLNDFFRGWWTSGENRLPFVYNAHALMYHLYRPGWQLYEEDIRVVHWTGPQNKPWMLKGEHVVGPTQLWVDVLNDIKVEWPSLLEDIGIDRQEELATAPGGGVRVEVGEIESFCAKEEFGRRKMYQGCDQIYVLHADSVRSVLLSAQDARTEFETFYGKQVDSLVSIVGGWSGINLLLYFNPGKIKFFDINRAVVEYFSLVIQLVIMSETRSVFMSRLFGRVFGAGVSLATQEGDFLRRPLDRGIVQSTIEQLPEGFTGIYEWLMANYMASPMKVDPNSARNCEHLLPFFASPSAFPKLNPGAKPGSRPANQCTLYYGHGWLAGEDEYSRVREKLSTIPIEMHHLDAFNKDFKELLEPDRAHAVYLSNLCMWSTKQCLDLFRTLDYKLTAETTTTLMLMHSHLQQPHVISSLNNMKTCGGVPEHASDPHQVAWHALKEVLQGYGAISASGNLIARDHAVVEVTTKKPWGFYEIPGRLNYKIEEFLNTQEEADTVILHILLGEGTDLATFNRALGHALRLSTANVIVLEHNKDSADWAFRQERSFSLAAKQVRKFVSAAVEATDGEFGIDRECYLRGALDQKRNMLFAVRKATART